MRYKSGYTETMIRESCRHLATSELEQVGRFFWSSVFETSRQSKLSIQSAIAKTSADAILMAELLPKETSVGRQGGKQSNTWGGGRLIKNNDQTDVLKIKSKIPKRKIPEKSVPH